MSDTPASPQKTPGFDWAIYADATFAGLAVLIPIPLLDLLVEWVFKRRMPAAIARRHDIDIDWRVVRELNRGRFGCWPGCLVWPVLLIFEFLKRLYRTVLYFLTIKSATDQLSYYWHRAFLLDHMLRRGDLTATLDRATVAAHAMDTVLRQSATSPLLQLARQVIDGVSHLLRTAWGWVRRRQEDEVMVSTRQRMARAWSDFDDYFATIAIEYDAVFEQFMREAAAAPDTMP